jgi:hypothetical protein
MRDALSLERGRKLIFNYAAGGLHDIIIWIAKQLNWHFRPKFIVPSLHQFSQLFALLVTYNMACKAPRGRFVTR